MFSKLKTWFLSSAWPALENFFDNAVHTEVEALTPIAQTAVTQLTTEEAAALVSGNTADTGHILAKVVKDTTAQATAAGINAGVHSILTAVGGAIAAKQ